MIYKDHTNCRVCNSQSLTPYLDLGFLPLSNNLAISTVDPIHGQKYPLKVLLCEDCGLSQLSIVIPPEIMFSNYVYRSSISQGYIDHCKTMAITLQTKYHLNKNSFHIDIAGNDGALLQQFKEVIGCRVLNVDPAKNLAGICEAAGIPCLTMFWGIEAAQRLLNSSGYGKADLITATNVFAHVDNVKEFIEAAKLVLKPTGVLVLEFPYIVDFIENREFDVVYFEHLSYFSIYPLSLLCTQVGLHVMSVSKQDIHGGSVRVTIGYGHSDNTVSKFVKEEIQNYSSNAVYFKFAEDVQTTINKFRHGLSNLKGLVAGFAASAKGNTLLNYAGVTVGKIRYIVDATPEKIGKYSPGTFIPIVSMDDLVRTPPDYLILLAWNWADELMYKARKAGYKGKFVIPVPEWTIID